MEDKHESRINVEDLQQGEQELTADEAKEVEGGLLPAVRSATTDTSTSTQTNTSITDGTNVILPAVQK